MDLKPLDQLYTTFKKAAHEMAGYPVNQFFDYSPLYRFLEFSINNIGDPFEQTSNYKINTHRFEKEVIDQFAALFHIPKDHYWGYVTNGGTEGNLYGLLVARERYPQGMVYYSDQTHYSVAKIVRLLRMEATEVPATHDGEIDYQCLQEAILAHPDKTPIVVLNIGTTMKGAIDDVVRVIDLFSDLDIRHYHLHCDAAFFGMLLPYISELRCERFDFRMGIDSIAVSGHKMIGTPMPCGIVIVKKTAMEHPGLLIEYTGSKDNTIMGSRNGFTPLLLWYELQCAKENFEHKVNACMEVAAYAIKRLNENHIKAWRNKNSIIVVIPRPAAAVTKKWQLASQGDISHIITLPHITTETIEQILADLLV